MSSPSITVTSDTPNTKKKRFSKLRIRGGGKGSDRPKVSIIALCVFVCARVRMCVYVSV